MQSDISEISVRSQSLQNQEEFEPYGRTSSSTTLLQDFDDLGMWEEPETFPEPTYLPRIRSRRHSIPQTSAEIRSIFESSPNNSDDDDADDFRNEDDNDEYRDRFEDYSTPNLEEDPSLDPNSFSDSPHLWILLWIMSFRIRFNLPETATESLIKFIKLLLTESGNPNFDTFPGTLYLAKKELGIKDNFRFFAVCPKCNKLYNKQEVEKYKENGRYAAMKCQHIEFPNSATRRNRPCGRFLAEKVPALNCIKYKPELIFPFSGIRRQLMDFYNRPNFENRLRHWINRRVSNGILSDIYDGKVWNNFKENEDENSPNFFRTEKADSHLGLMINLDWFQPFDNTVHSTGVIYAAICNLPRDLRFRRENLLILGLLPGPNEVSLHKINHYLAPIVDELEELWSGFTLSKTYECANGKEIRAALILVSCDVPAARKICGHASALISCHRCEKKANFENQKHNFAGMNNLSEWFIARDSAKHRQEANDWRRCNSQAARKRYVTEKGMRWSELLRLPYFDPIRFITIDPMHCLFLGIVKWIIKRIWVDMGILSSNILNSIQKKMNEFQVPADVGRIPGKIHCGEGFSNFTADQWRIFISIYATVVLWEYLGQVDRKILNYLVQICQSFAQRNLEEILLNEIHDKLIKVVTLIESEYGREMITPNLHLSLHLAECSSDFGPLYAFWCFSFERMNGMLGK
jgi:hypothetical protein